MFSLTYICHCQVLTCLGIHLWERLHRLWQKLRAEEQTWQMLFYLGVEALRKRFEVGHFVYEFIVKQNFTFLKNICALFSD